MMFKSPFVERRKIKEHRYAAEPTDAVWSSESTDLINDGTKGTRHHILAVAGTCTRFTADLYYTLKCNRLPDVFKGVPERFVHLSSVSARSLYLSMHCNDGKLHRFLTREPFGWELTNDEYLGLMDGNPPARPYTRLKSSGAPIATAPVVRMAVTEPPELTKKRDQLQDFLEYHQRSVLSPKSLIDVLRALNGQEYSMEVDHYSCAGPAHPSFWRIDVRVPNRPPVWFQYALPPQNPMFSQTQPKPFNMDVKNFIKKQPQPMIPWQPGMDMTGVSVSAPDAAAGSPKAGDYIAWNPANPAEKRLIAADFHAANYMPAPDPVQEQGKTFGNTDANGARKNVKDIVFWGNGDLFRLISKASSKAEGWMKSTKAMEIPGVGCVVQVTTQQGDQVAEAVTFVPGVAIREEKDSDGTVVSRSLVAAH